MPRRRYSGSTRADASRAREYGFRRILHVRSTTGLAADYTGVSSSSVAGATIPNKRWGGTRHRVETPRDKSGRSPRRTQSVKPCRPVGFGEETKLGKMSSEVAAMNHADQVAALQEQVALLTEKLAQAQRLTYLGELASTTSHEFN